MEDLHLTEINIFPIKSLGGVSLTNSKIERRGLKYDRRWMLVDSDNIFISQRKFPALALFKISLKEEYLEINNHNYGSAILNFNEHSGVPFDVTVWDSSCKAVEVNPNLNAFFSEYLKMKVRLVHMPEESIRRVEEKYSYNDDIVSFADGFPVLLIGEASLSDLNSKLSSPVLMNRFRPNLVINTTLPFDEDNWVDFSVGESNFKVVKPCSRCIMTTIDQETGHKGKEPLTTLSTYRNFSNKIMFGQNLLYTGGKDEVAVGEKIKISSRRKI